VAALSGLSGRRGLSQATSPPEDQRTCRRWRSEHAICSRLSTAPSFWSSHTGRDIGREGVTSGDNPATEHLVVERMEGMGSHERFVSNRSHQLQSLSLPRSTAGQCRCSLTRGLSYAERDRRVSPLGGIAQGSAKGDS
jgi:hypothetical protein